MKTELTTLFTATAFALGRSPEDETSAEMTRFQLKLIEFWENYLPSALLNSPYERKELLKLYFYWEQAETLMASAR